MKGTSSEKIRTRQVTLALLVLTWGCSGTSPAVPTPVTVSVPQTWTLTGQVLSSQTQRPIAGARLLDVTTDGNGLFNASGSGVRVDRRVTIEADGYVTRETQISGGTQHPIIDLLSGPLDFYRDLVRNGFEQPGALEPIRRWTSAPKFYIVRAADVTSEEIRRIQVGILAATQQISAFGLVGIEVGPERADEPGWVTMRPIDEPETNFCGQALIGDNPGRISLNLETTSRSHFPCGRFCPGSRVSPGTVAHEVGHALGFWHTSAGLMKTGLTAEKCSENVQFAPAEREAARIAFSRQPGNIDPDTDAIGRAFVGPARLIRD